MNSTMTPQSPAAPRPAGYPSVADVQQFIKERMDRLAQREAASRPECSFRVVSVSFSPVAVSR